jgi:hypothetical protein
MARRLSPTARLVCGVSAFASVLSVPLSEVWGVALWTLSTIGWAFGCRLPVRLWSVR